MSEMMTTNSLVKIKEAPPYGPDLEGPVLMNSLARATLDPKTGSYSFQDKQDTSMKFDTGNVGVVKGIFEHTERSAEVAGVGVDQGSSKSIFDSKLSRCLFVCRTHKFCPILELDLPCS
jgi:fatty acid synthase subunit alpha